MKTASLVLSLVLALSYAAIGCNSSYGLYDGCGALNRITYLFIHGSWMHLLINIYCFLSLVFLCEMRWRHLVSSLIIASTIMIPCPIPVVGISTLLYAVTGMMMFRTRQWWWLATLNLLFIGAGGMITGIAFLAHLYCFIAGMAIGLLFEKRHE